jgi:nucleotide-binding universal stress UspA family protein
MDEAALRGSSLELVHAWQYPSGLGAYALLAAGGAEDSARNLLSEEAGRTRRRAVAEVRETLVQGPPAKVLTDVAAGAELLVVGSRGRGGFTGLVLGSVGQHCAAHARCPTVVVHRTEDGPDGQAGPEVTAEYAGSPDPGRTGRGSPLGQEDERLAALRSQMEAARREFIDLTVRFATDWIPHQVASVVEGNPDHATELGTGGLGPLKAEMQEMVAELPASTEEAVGAGVSWPDRLGDPSELPAPWEGWHEVDQLVHHPPEELTEAVSRVVDRTRWLLARHGFVRGQAEEVYVPNYSTEVSWTPDMVEASNRYCRLYQSFYAIALQSLTEAESTARVEARRLWEEA